MSNYKAGDKFIIEISEAIKGYGNDPESETPCLIDAPVLYRIKGFNALVFDEYGLAKLKRYEPEASKPWEPMKRYRDREDLLEASRSAPETLTVREQERLESIMSIPDGAVSVLAKEVGDLTMQIMEVERKRDALIDFLNGETEYGRYVVDFVGGADRG